MQIITQLNAHIRIECGDQKQQFHIEQLQIIIDILLAICAQSLDDAFECGIGQA